MRNFRFRLNNQFVNEPNNWEDFEENFIRDETKRHVFFDYPISLDFIGDGYQYLDEVYQENYDSQTLFEVSEITESSEVVIFRTFIKTSNITFDLIRDIATTQIDDVVYQSYIFNNYSVEVGCGAQKSKNDFDIDSIPSLDLYLFTPSTGVRIEEEVRAYDVKSVMSMIIDYVSDGSINFESTWYDSLPTNERLAIATGLEIRTRTGRTAPIISLEAMFDELWKKFNLYLIVEDPISNPTIRLEEESYLYGSENIQVLNVSNLSRSIDFDRLYSTINLGSNKAIKERSATYLFPYLRLFAFVEETFNISGVVNVDNQLDLVSDFVIDTNVFQDVLENGSENYDEDIFLIQYDGGSLDNEAIAGDYFEATNPSARFYNEILLNSNVADRFQVLGNLVLETGLIQTAFRAQQNVGLNYIGDLGAIGDCEIAFPLQTFIFQDDTNPPNFDIGDDYDPLTGKYKAIDEGDHVFRSVFRINTFGNPGQSAGRPGFDFTLTLRVSNNLDTANPTSYLITQIFADSSTSAFSISPTDSFTIPLGVEITLVEIIHTRIMQIDDEATVRAQMEVCSTSAFTYAFGVNLSTFELIASPLAGGTYQIKDPDDYFVNLLESNSILIDPVTWEDFKSDISSRINISDDKDQVRVSFAKKITRKLASGESDIETLFNRKQPII
jgi:hypothetical protein